MSIKSAIEQAVNEIYQRDGEVKPSVLVETAKPKDHPAHDAFEWNNAKAGHEYRMMQARQWIKRVHITINGEAERLFHITLNPETDEDAERELEGCYKPASVIVQSVDEFDIALKQLRHQVQTARESYEYLKKKAADAKDEAQPRINFPVADQGFQQVQAALG